MSAKEFEGKCDRRVELTTLPTADSWQAVMLSYKIGSTGNVKKTNLRKVRLIFYSQVVAICTTRFKIKIYTLCLQSACQAFVWLSKMGDYFSLQH